METLKGVKGEYTIEGQMWRRSKIGGTLRAHDAQGQTVTIKKIVNHTPEQAETLRAAASIVREDLSRIREVFVGEDGCLYCVREYVCGTDLKSIFADKKIYGKIDEMQFVKMGCAVLKALAALHEAGIVHRDVKPNNIIIHHAEGVSPLDADFSQVTLIDLEHASRYPADANARATFSLIYSPPEMVVKRTDMIGPTADLFALGITIYHLIIGKTPYTDCNPEILINLQLTYPMKKPSRMTDELYQVLSRAAYKEPFRLPPRKLTAEEVDETLQKGISKRYQTAAEMAADLEKVTMALTPQNWIQKLLS